jgi:pyridoxine 5-phosphate synthase
MSQLLMATARTGVNLELAASSDVLDIACELRPWRRRWFPNVARRVTTEGGLALGDADARRRVGDAVRRLRDAGIRTSLFIAPDSGDIDASADLGVDAIELHTGEYAEAWKLLHGAGGRAGVARELDRIASAAAHARGRGLDVHAGHGLTYENVSHVAAIHDIEELNIGHSVVSRALFTGMEQAVREMKRPGTARHRRTGTPCPHRASGPVVRERSSGHRRRYARMECRGDRPCA